MTIEEKLKDLILSRYKSIREFTQIVGLPYTTIDSILRRGIPNASIGNVIKICRVLHLNADALVEGEIVFNFENMSDSSKTEIKDIVGDLKYRLDHTQQITIDGKVIDVETKESFLEALDIGFEIARKKHNKNITKTITKTITESENV